MRIYSKRFGTNQVGSPQEIKSNLKYEACVGVKQANDNWAPNEGARSKDIGFVFKVRC